MDIVRNPDIDWLGMKWIFLTVSAVLAVIGGISLFMLNGLNLGVDFTGGTLVYVKFEDTPDLARIREVLSSSELQAQEVTRFDEPGANQVQIRIARASEEAEA